MAGIVTGRPSGGRGAGTNRQNGRRSPDGFRYSPETQRAGEPRRRIVEAWRRGSERKRKPGIRKDRRRRHPDDCRALDAGRSARPGCAAVRAHLAAHPDRDGRRASRRHRCESRAVGEARDPARGCSTLAVGTHQRVSSVWTGLPDLVAAARDWCRGWHRVARARITPTPCGQAGAVTMPDLTSNTRDTQPDAVVAAAPDGAVHHRGRAAVHAGQPRRSPMPTSSCGYWPLGAGRDRFAEAVAFARRRRQHVRRPGVHPRGDVAAARAARGDSHQLPGHVADAPGHLRCLPGLARAPADGDA